MSEQSVFSFGAPQGVVQPGLHAVPVMFAVGFLGDGLAVCDCIRLSHRHPHGCDHPVNDHDGKQLLVLGVQRPLELVKREKDSLF
jgi:hypothetical protein